MFLVLVLVAIFAPWLTPYQPQKQDYTLTQQPPSRRISSAPTTSGATSSPACSTGRASTCGWASSRYRRPSSSVSSWVRWPAITAAGSTRASCGWSIWCRRSRLLCSIIAIVAVLGPGLNNMYVAVAIVAWIVYARLMRGEILVEKHKEYVVAARAIGGNDWRIIGRHVLPNVITSSIVYAMADIALYILLAASLSFLGLGAQAADARMGRDDHRGARFHDDRLVDERPAGAGDHHHRDFAEPHRRRPLRRTEAGKCVSRLPAFEGRWDRQRRAAARLCCSSAVVVLRPACGGQPC